MSEAESLILDVLHHTEWKSLQQIADEITDLKIGAGAHERTFYFVLGTVYTALDRLCEKGLALSRFRDSVGEEIAARGGRQVREAKLTEDGTREKTKQTNSEEMPDGALAGV